MITLAVAWLLGTCVLLAQAELPAALFVAGTCVVAALFAAGLRSVAPLAFALGFALSWQQAADRLGDRLDPALEGRTLTIEGLVASVPQVVADGLRFRLATDTGSNLPRVIALTWYQPDRQLHAGE